MQRYAYDSVNFRLSQIKAEKFTNPTALTYQPVSGNVRQDGTYTYDLAGNIVQTVDSSPNSGIAGGASLTRDFEYDPLYRLLSATGRESTNYSNSASPWAEGHVPQTDQTQTRGYTRLYTYDRLGNMLKMEHNAATSFNRIFNSYAGSGTTFTSGNLCNQIDYGTNSISYSFDAVGNMISEGTSRNMEWDAGDQLRAFYIQAGTSEPSVYTHYQYDAGGNRIKKLTRKSSGNTQVSIYIDGAIDFHYEIDNTGNRTEELCDIHVMDDRQRIARREIYGSTHTGTQTNPVKYNLEDHLGNGCFTLDANGALYSREEYFPFGETSFGSYAKKRYRFTQHFIISGPS